jgi:diadenosine tetraphosphatase ApaH/serine/threonine PP2A family protein phosphatase
MRIAILSDIHSNLQALTKALEEIDAASVDSLYCLGDVVGYGGNPNECLDLIRRLASHVVRGNHDHAAIDEEIAEGFSRSGRKAATWTRKTLTDENLEYISALPMKLDLPPCTLVHASPLQPERWTYVLSLDVAKKQFPAFSEELCFIGHTHVPAVCGEDMRTFEFHKGPRMLVNPGSVGQPRDGNPRLSFGLLDTGTWEYSNIRSDYDIDGAAKAIRDAGLPDVLARRLFEGS